MGDIEDRIRHLAHRLWVEDGMPADRDVEHWFRASQIVRREIVEETMALADPNPAVEAEDFDGVVNPDPAARHGDEPAEQRSAVDLRPIETRVGGATRPVPLAKSRGAPQAGSSVADK